MESEFPTTNLGAAPGSEAQAQESPGETPQGGMSEQGEVTKAEWNIASRRRDGSPARTRSRTASGRAMSTDEATSTDLREVVRRRSLSRGRDPSDAGSRSPARRPETPSPGRGRSPRVLIKAEDSSPRGTANLIPSSDSVGGRTGIAWWQGLSSAHSFALGRLIEQSRLVYKPIPLEVREGTPQCMLQVWDDADELRPPVACGKDATNYWPCIWSCEDYLCHGSLFCTVCLLKIFRARQHRVNNEPVPSLDRRGLPPDFWCEHVEGDQRVCDAQWHSVYALAQIERSLEQTREVRAEYETQLERYAGELSSSERAIEQADRDLSLIHI